MKRQTPGGTGTPVFFFVRGLLVRPTRSPRSVWKTGTRRSTALDRFEHVRGSKLRAGRLHWQASGTRHLVSSVLAVLLTLLLAVGLRAAEMSFVTESTREIPIARSVDVVVVGGSTHAVSAAVAAAAEGASVFLAAPRPYLGEDLCDSLRLRLPAGREPKTDLARRIFRRSEQGRPIARLPFRYTASLPSQARHRDTTPPGMLSDGRARNAPSESVQYNGDVVISVDLGEVHAVRSIELLAFEKQGDYGVASVAVQAGTQPDTCAPVGKTEQRVTTSGTAPWSRIQLVVPVGRRVRHLMVQVTRPEGCERLLLGELSVEPENDDASTEPDPAPQFTTTPHRVKSVLDQTLLDAGVEFLYGCYATDVLVDSDGKPAGIVMANRAGRQAVIAKTIIDATAAGVVAAMAGAQRPPWPKGPVTFHRVVLERGKAGETITVEHQLTLSPPDGSFRSFAQAEQEARDQTYTQRQLRASAFLSYVPPEPIVCRKPASDSQEGGQIDLAHFIPRQVDRLFVLSGLADIPRALAKQLTEPCGLMPIGSRIGIEAARISKATAFPAGIHVRSSAHVPDTEADVRDTEADVREMLHGMRPTSSSAGTVPSGKRSLPVLGRYDVIVIGGGTAGAAAGIGAARRGARTLVVEYQEGLGGVGTLGLIGKAYHGRAVGFGAEVPFPNKDYHIEAKMEWYRRELRQAGADIWFGVLGCGALVAGDQVQGAVVATPQGRGVVLARTTIDATGNADLAVAAGADWMYGANAAGIAMQGTGLPVRSLHAYYTNSDYLLVDESDMLDVWRALVGAKATMAGDVFDSGSLIQTRERRRVRGDHIMTYLDQISGRTYPDSVVFSGSDYDSHGYPNHVFFALLPHDQKSLKANHPAPGGTCYTPYRSLLPKGLDGMLVIGLGISMDRDASAMVRMQRDISNQGYAAGVAAALAAEQNVSVRGIDIRRLQQHLAKTGALPKEVLSHQDSFPLPRDQVQAAVSELPRATNPKTAGVPLAIILSHADMALPMLQAAYTKASGPARLTYAKVLGMMGDATGVDVLIAALSNVKQFDNKILQGVAAEYAHLPTPVDALILALGFSGDRRALEPILAKLEMLSAEDTLSHHRSVALALEHLADPRAAEPLARLLQKPGMRGHVMLKWEPLHNREREKRRRTGPLREIVLARALYHCGDHNGLGRQILGEYRKDIRGLFARHAQAVLEQDRRRNDAVCR